MSTTPETAVQRCLDAYNQANAREDARNDFSPEALARVNRAYRHAMPVLAPHPDSVDIFIACVTHGIIFGVFEASEGSKLLYAAQVAIGSRRARLEAERQHSKSQTAPKPANGPTPLTSSEAKPASPTASPATPPPSLHPRQPQTAKPSHLSTNQLEALLEQLYAGHLPKEHSPNLLEVPGKALSGPLPPTPSTAVLSTHATPPPPPPPSPTSAAERYLPAAN